MSGMVQKKIGLGKYDIGQLTNLVEVSEDDGAMPGIDCSKIDIWSHISLYYLAVRFLSLVFSVTYTHSSR